MDSILRHIAAPVEFLGRGMLDLLFPPICEICEEKLNSDERFLCRTCLDTLPVQLMPASPQQTEVLSQVCCLFYFDENVKQLLHLMKYSRRPGLGMTLLDHCAERVFAELSKHQYDVILPVPLHPRKERERGYNQVTELVKALAELLGAEASQKGLRRLRYTRSQTKLSAEQRQKNVENAFQIGKGFDPVHRRLLVVDDVYTTGSTAAACATALVAAGARSVHLFTLATAEMENA